MPGRAELSRAPRQLLKQGGATKADLHLVDLGEGPIVVKDFAAKGWWVRWIGRLQIARECSAYRWLGSMPGLPGFVGRVDAHALALERIPGIPLFRVSRSEHRGAELLARLRDVIDRLHAEGLSHLDLRGRENVLLGDDGEVYVLDLAGAVWFRPRGLAHRWLFPWFALTDRAALLKWKEVLEAGPYTDAERAFLRRYRFWRSMWIFNRKTRARRRDSMP